MEPGLLWIIFILLNGSAAMLSLVAGVVSSFSLGEIEELRRHNAKAAIALERCRGEQGNTLAAFEVLIAAFVGMSALLGGIIFGPKLFEIASAQWISVACNFFCSVNIFFYGLVNGDVASKNWHTFSSHLGA
jgi:hypothetical protein